MTPPPPPLIQLKEFVHEEDEVKVHITGDIEEGEISSDEEGEIKGVYVCACVFVCLHIMKLLPDTLVVYK